MTYIIVLNMLLLLLLLLFEIHDCKNILFVILKHIEDV